MVSQHAPGPTCAPIHGGAHQDPSQCVRVAVNIRPLITSELINGCTDCIAVVPGESQVQIGTHAFTFDYVYGNGGLAYGKIFDNCVQPLVDSLFHGYNATVLAYGQTGSGKTYTMGTNYAGNDNDNGIIPQVMESIFSKVDAARDTTEFLIRVSFIEIFKEEVFDLLDTSSTQSKSDGAIETKISALSRVPIQIRETVNGGITLFGVTEAEVRTRAEMVSYLLRGSLCRATASTNMNSQSSRSHAIFTISLEKKNIAQCTNGESHTLSDDILSAKLHLVDLAGSERAKRTGGDGKRLKEGIHINKGLLALGNVISALGDEKKRKEGGHVPYRDSKLTRLLQDSLGGNSKTVMIACVSPADSNTEETLNTLKYANRARNIQNKAIINRDPIAAQTQQMRNQIEQLQAELIYLRGDAGLPFEELQMLRKKVSLLEAGNAELRRDLNNHLPFYESLVQCTLSAQDEKHKILSKLKSARDGQSLDESAATLNQFLDSVRSYMEKNQDLERKLLKFYNMSSAKHSSLNDLIYLEDNEVTERSDHFTGHEDYSVCEAISLNFIESDENGGHEKEREHASIQEKLDSELRELDKMLQQKEAEMNQFTNVNTSVLKQHYEKKVMELEHEKRFLLREIEQLKNNLANISSVSDDGAQKLKDEYLKKLSLLESQVSDLKKRQDSQSHLLRQKQKSDDAAKRLQDEIQRIKTQKVQLQHKIKQESEQFRLWKASREKEVMQLKKEGRRNEYEMHKLLALNQRQKMVLQRKTEEATAATRRLKELLESRKASSRETFVTGNNQVVMQAVEHELEVTARVYEVRSEYEHQTEERAKMAKEVAKLKEEMKLFKRSENLCSSPDALSPGARNSRIFALENMLSTSSGILVSMASQLSEAEGRERVFSGKGRWNQLRSLSDAKEVLNHLFDMASSTRCQIWDQQVICREKDSQIRDLKEKVVRLSDRIRLLELQNRIEIHPQNLKERSSVVFDGESEKVQDDMDMSESDASDEEWVATDTEPDTEVAPHKNRNKPTARPSIIPSESQGEMLRLMSAAADDDTSLHCTCGKFSLCKTSKCKCRSNGVSCGPSCGCLSKKCVNRVDPIASSAEGGDGESDQTLASEGALLLQSAFTEKTKDGRRTPLSDIGNTMAKSNLLRPNRRKKVWKKSAIRLVPVLEKAGDGRGERKQEESGSSSVPVEGDGEDFGQLKLPRAMRSAAMADNSRSFRERNPAGQTGCTDARENS